MDKSRIQGVPLNQVHIDDPFWSKYVALVRDVVIPYQWEALNDRIPDAAPSYAIRNFRIAAGLEEGDFNGMVFQDSDLAKWLEAVSYSLATHPDPRLEQLADETIATIVLAQQKDGYLNTYFTIKAPDKRWTNLNECHELYCAGHMMEAAVAYFQATGKRKLLDAMCRFADHIDQTFGAEPGKLHGYPGHQEIELALVKLYSVTAETRYLRLAEYFINERGKKPSFFIDEWEKRGRSWHWPVGPHAKLDLCYNQSHVPVREQSVAVGHAVRAVYMYSAMADLARLTGDDGLLDACRRLWGNVTTRQMYVTGGIGSTHHGEAFSFDYDLPNDTVYAETCASIGLIFFAHRMLQIEPKREYADVLERALYNIVIASMSLDGRRYFYVNPLEVWPEASEKNPAKHHVKAERQKWFGCACCPPNVARLLASLGQYIYSVDDSTLYTHLFIGSTATLAVQGDPVDITQRSDFPWDGHVSFSLGLASSKSFSLALRVPSWCTDAPAVRVNGQVVSVEFSVNQGYISIHRTWADGDVVETAFTMTPKLIQANPNVRTNAGRVAIARGPLVYCLEEFDNGVPVSAVSVSMDQEWRDTFDENLFGGTMVIEGSGWRDEVASWDEQLYRPVNRSSIPVSVRAIPYYLWGNRGLGEMSVWVRSR